MREYITSEDKIGYDQVSFSHIPLPERVYKYRNWKDDFHKRILTHCEIHFDNPYNSAGSAIDELIFKWNFNAVSFGEIYMWYYNEALNHGVFGDENRRRYAETNLHHASFWSLTKLWNFEINQKVRLNERVSIFCVSANKGNRHLWEHFANYQQGFCVGFDSKKLFTDKEKFGFGGMVKYCPPHPIPMIHPFSYNINQQIDSYQKRIMYLPSKFHEEEEYRLAKLNLETKSFSVSSECYREVILGSEMDENSAQAISKIVKEKFPHATLSQAKLQAESGSYSFEQLH